jgi:hypothetical protein
MAALLSRSLADRSPDRIRSRTQVERSVGSLRGSPSTSPASSSCRSGRQAAPAKFTSKSWATRPSTPGNGERGRRCGCLNRPATPCHCDSGSACSRGSSRRTRRESSPAWRSTGWLGPLPRPRAHDPDRLLERLAPQLAPPANAIGGLHVGGEGLPQRSSLRRARRGNRSSVSQFPMADEPLDRIRREIREQTVVAGTACEESRRRLQARASAPPATSQPTCRSPLGVRRKRPALASRDVALSTTPRSMPVPLRSRPRSRPGWRSRSP